MPLAAVTIEELRRKHYDATVTRIERVNSELMILRVRADHPATPARAGQYGTLGLGLWENRLDDLATDLSQVSDETKLVRRAYSLSHPMLEKEADRLAELPPGECEFYIVLVRETAEHAPTALTPRLFALNDGARISLGHKFTGHYTLEGVEPEQTIVFLGTGTGEAPHNAMLHELLVRGHRGPIVMVSCCRYHRDLAYFATHERLMRLFKNYQYIALTTREPSEGRKLYIQDLYHSGELEARLGHALDPASTRVFLCGHPLMIGAPTRDKTTGNVTYPAPRGMVELLEERGFVADRGKQRGNIHFEEYW